MKQKMTILIALCLILPVAFWLYLKFGGQSDGRLFPLQVGSSHLQVEVAKTMATRAQGLSGREGLPPDQGMLFLFSSSSPQGFWMKEMLFPIDIIWINNKKIVGMALDTQPEPEKSLWQLTTYYSPGPVDMVLEVTAGTAKTKGWQVGDSVLFESADVK